MTDKKIDEWIDAEARSIINAFNHPHTNRLEPTLILAGADARLIMTTDQIEDPEEFAGDIHRMCTPVFTCGRYVQAIILAFPAKIKPTSSLAEGLPLLEDPEAGALRLVIIGSRRDRTLCSRAYPIDSSTFTVDHDSGFNLANDADPIIEVVDGVWEAAFEAARESQNEGAAPLSLRGAGIEVQHALPHVEVSFHEMPVEMLLRMLEEQS